MSKQIPDVNKKRNDAVDIGKDSAKNCTIQRKPYLKRTLFAITGFLLGAFFGRVFLDFLIQAFQFVVQFLD